MAPLRSRAGSGGAVPARPLVPGALQSNFPP